MKIALASDHAGYAEKEQLKPLLKDLGIDFEDLGTASNDSVDYPLYARKVAEKVSHGEVEQGLLVCGSGTGMAIAANKVPGVRAAACVDAGDRAQLPRAQRRQRAGPARALRDGGHRRRRS